MVFFNYSTMQMAAKVVYYGPGLCGKTTNLQWIFEHTSNDSRGEMVSLATETDRTLFFDLLPIDVGSIAGFSTRIQLYTVPGQVFYNTTRKLVLKGVDGVVFVADSQRPMLQANAESLQNLEENLGEMGLSLDTVPVVLQYNKRDLPNICTIEELNAGLNRGNWPHCEASALNGNGVFETLKMISKATLMALKKRLTKGRPETPAPAIKRPLSPTPAPAPPRPASITPPPRPAVAPAPEPAPSFGSSRPGVSTGPFATPSSFAPSFEAPPELEEPRTVSTPTVSQSREALPPIEDVFSDTFELEAPNMAEPVLASPEPPTYSSSDFSTPLAAPRPAAGPAPSAPAGRGTGPQPVVAPPRVAEAPRPTPSPSFAPSPSFSSSPSSGSSTGSQPVVRPLAPAHAPAAAPSHPAPSQTGSHAPVSSGLSSHAAPSHPAPSHSAPSQPAPSQSASSFTVPGPAPRPTASPASSSGLPAALSAAALGATSPPAPKKPKTGGGLDVLAELEKLRKETIVGRPMPAPVAARPALNGKHEISRELRVLLNPANLQRARRFSMTLQLEDADHRPVDEVRHLHVDLDAPDALEQLLLRLEIALQTST